MTQEEKQLLLTDICARLLYKPVCHAGKINHDGNLYFINIIYNTVALTSDKAVGKFETCPIDDVKPYLRPMSSMTEEEINEFILISDTVLWLGNKGTTCILSLKQMDWLNERSFDYRGLIPMGLALEAPEGMYNTSQKWTPLRSGLKENEDGQIVGGVKL